MEVKVILVKESTQHFEGLLKDGWSIAHAFTHAQGALFVLGRKKEIK